MPFDVILTVVVVLGIFGVFAIAAQKAEKAAAYKSQMLRESKAQAVSVKPKKK